MNLRIQTYGQSPCGQHLFSQISHVPATEGTTVYDALEKGFDDLMNLCDVVETKFTAARDEFAARMEA